MTGRWPRGEALLERLKAIAPDRIVTLSNVKELLDTLGPFAAQASPEPFASAMR